MHEWVKLGGRKREGHEKGPYRRVMREKKNTTHGRKWAVEAVELMVSPHQKGG